MKHNKIQKKFLLYNDGYLSEAEKLLIEQHLDVCGDCKRYFEELANIWNEERKLESPLPSQALWYDLKDRIEKERFKKAPITIMVSNAKILLNTAFTMFVIVFAVFVGSKLGSELTPKGSTESGTYDYSENIKDEFGMSYFDAVPPNSLAKDIFIPPANNEGMRK
jgi:predicted anti-sigma-YlaC factor YlaD